MQIQNRRNFLRLTSGSLLASVFLPKTISANEISRLSLLNSSNELGEDYWKMVRKQFPLKNDFLYLNNGTMGPSPYYVIERTQKAMMEADEEGNYGGWENTCKKIADFVGAHQDEIVLTRNVTEGINIICNGLELKKGDEVIVTTHEHGGNAFPWLNIAKQKGIVLKALPPGKTAEDTLNRFSLLLNAKTKAIAIPHILCTQGQILPVKEITKLAQEKGVFVFIDGAHGPGMLKLDLHDMNCDAYATCCHKWMLGPKGTGFLYIKKESFEKIKPWFVGAGSDNGKWNMAAVPPQMGDYAVNAHRYYAGTFNGGLCKGVVASIEFIEAIGQENITNRIFALAAYAQQQLLALGDGIEMLTPVEPKSRGAVIGFRVKGKDSLELYEKIMESRIRIRQVHENGLNSLRISTHIYNTQQDVDVFISKLKTLI